MFEVLFVWFLYPETQGRTLEELAFCEFPLFLGDVGIRMRLMCE